MFKLSIASARITVRFAKFERAEGQARSLPCILALLPSIASKLFLSCRGLSLLGGSFSPVVRDAGRMMISMKSLANLPISANKQRGST